MKIATIEKSGGKSFQCVAARKQFWQKFVINHDELHDATIRSARGLRVFVVDRMFLG